MTIIFDKINIILILIAFVNFVLGYFILSKSFKNKISIVYSLNILSIIGWIFGMVLYRSALPENSLFWCIVLYVSATIIPSIFLYFTYIFPSQKEGHIWQRNILIFGINIFIIILTLYPGLIVEGVNTGMGFEKQIIFTPYYLVYFLYIAGYFLFAFFRLFKKYFNEAGAEKTQIIFVLFGVILSSGIAFITNLIMPWIGVFYLNWLGQVATILMVIFTAYAITKYHLFDIRAIATEILIFLIWLILLIRTLFSSNYQELALNIFMLFSVGLIGALLIRGVLRIEKMSKDIKAAYEVEKKANEELKRVDETKSQFLAIANHHLRTPLTAINWYTDLLVSGKYGKISKKSKEVIDKIKEATSDEIKIVGDLLDVSQFQLGTDIVNLKPDVSVDNIFKQIIRDIAPEAEQKKVKIIFNTNKSVQLISADESKLRVALTNILDNAVKYTESGEVFVELKSNSGKILITIKDTGIGMSEAELKNIFVKTFERGKNAQKIFATGKGIGLYISAKIIEAHHGKIWAESEGKNKGSAFYIELPQG